MDFKFSKDTDSATSPKQEASGGGNRQTALLLVLLMLVGGFGYVYFFTDLVKPQSEQKPAEMPAPQVVKKPLPAANAPAAQQVAGTPATAPPVASEKKDGAASGNAEPAKVAQAVTVTPAGKEQAKAVQEPKKPEPVKSDAAKPLPAPADANAQKTQVLPKTDENKPAAVEQKAAAAAEKKSVAAGKADKKTAVDKGAAGRDKTATSSTTKSSKSKIKTAKKPVAVAAKESAGPWTVLVGNYMLEDAMAADMARIRKTGLQAAIQQGARKKTPMHRLFLAEYADRSAAQAELEKLKKHTSDAFVLGQGGKYAVYAGSYLLDDRATSEKERLAAAGFALTLRSAEVAIPSRSLTAGTFSDKSAAEAVVAKLKSAGLKASLQR